MGLMTSHNLKTPCTKQYKKVDKVKFKTGQIKAINLNIQKNKPIITYINSLPFQNHLGIIYHLMAENQSDSNGKNNTATYTPRVTNNAK